MGFKFLCLCDLLSELEKNRIIKASTASKNSNPDGRAVTRWFAQHGKRIHSPDTDRTALLSCMFPEKRTDRVYWLQDTSLARVIGRCLLLGSSRREELERWRVAGGTDLGQCVEDVMRQTEGDNPSSQGVTIEEIDDALNKIASRCRFSGSRVRRQHTAVDVEETLGPLYRRLSSRDAKWLTRMILKSFHPVILPVNLTMKSFHFLLPHLLLFQDSFEFALKMLASEPLSHYPPNPDPKFAKDLSVRALQHLMPKVGIKIGRPDYYKARSIKHCCQMIGRRRMSIERKYDGEYCQVHIDLTKRLNPIQIFSKSGKDSTDDRAAIHSVIRDALNMGKSECRFSHQCILEGELLVWSDKHGRITDFHKLRRFISRSGTLLGIDNDSPPQPYEHLMIVFFDILLLDDDVCLRKPHRERRLLLKDLIKVADGCADIAEQQIVDFSRHDGQSRLEAIFRKGITERWEGLVLKGCEDPYFSIFPGKENGSAGRWIKLKKDYIPGLGDTVDLALVGARYDSRDAVALDPAMKISWTHFYIGCLVNKEAVLQARATPRLRVVDVIDRHCMSPKNMQFLNFIGKFSACDLDSGHGFLLEYGAANLARMDVVFKTPFVVEMLGSGFEKPSGARYYALRFPRIQKIHSDRSFEDAASYQELQLLAEEARSVPAKDLHEEEEWASRLRLVNTSKRYLEDRSQSPLSTTTSCPTQTPSPVKHSSSRGFAGTTESSCETNGQVSSRGSVQGQRANGAVRLPADHIPIYMDDSTVSASSPEPAEPSRKLLSSNDNLSAPQRSQKRPHPGPSNEFEKKSNRARYCETENTIQSNALNQSSIHQLSLERKRAKLTEGSAASVAPISPSKEGSCIKSLLKTISLCILPIPNDNDMCHRLVSVNAPNIVPSMEAFLQKLWSEESYYCVTSTNSNAPTQTFALGLIITAISRGSLGKLLLELSQEIARKFTLKIGKHPPNGKIFILENKFLALWTRINDNPSSNSRHTWEKIGREYFYACVSWSPAEDPESTSFEISEIPGTPMEGERRPQFCMQDHARLQSTTRAPRISITFDSQEIGVLGDLNI